MHVDFYFDPSCPFCWVTSRWLLMSKNKREIDIDWHFFSLAIKNDELNKDIGDGFDHRPAHRVARVMLAASKQGAPLLDMYTAFGIKHFLGGEEYDDDVIASVLEQLKLNPELLKSADDDSLDQELAQSTREAVDTVGDDIGVPTIVFTLEDGSKRGFFGPVIQTLPELDESIELWDGIVKLVNNNNFYEIKRGRSGGGPDVYSTAKC